MSQIKFLYISDTADSEPPLENGEGIMVIDAEGAYYITSLICNELYNGEIYAPEINWYLKNTLEESEAKKEIFKALYEIRYIRHLNTSVKKYSLDVERSVAIIGEGEEADDFVEYAKRFFDVTYINTLKLRNIDGKLGQFEISFESYNEEAQKDELQEIVVAQVIFCNENNDLTKKMGAESLVKNHTEDLIKRFRNRIGWYEYEESIKYDPTFCGFEHKENPTCKECLSICPTLGLTHDEAKKEIYFSHLDCINCGLCVSVCPHGAIDFTHFTQQAFLEVAKLCKDKTVFIVAQKYLENIEGIRISQGVLPLVVETDSFFTEFHFQKLLEEAHTIVMYSPQISAASEKAVHSINQIDKKISIAKNNSELEKIFVPVDLENKG